MKMKRNLVCQLLVPVILATTLNTALTANENEDPVTLEGLKLIEKGRKAFLASDTEDPFDSLRLIEKTRDGEIRTRKDVNWAVYTDIRLLDASVDFRENWLRDQNRHDRFKVRSSDMRDIEQELSEQFHRIVTDQLFEKGGYTQSGSIGEHVLTIKPAIVELNIAGPDASRLGTSHHVTDSSTSMTIKLELYDTESGVLLAAMTDHLEDQHRGIFQTTSSASNRSDSQRLLKQWAADLVHKLDLSSNNKMAHNKQP